MKSPMSQILMFTLAIVFAVALSLTIALICVSYVQEETPTDTRFGFEDDTTEPLSASATLPVYRPMDPLPESTYVSDTALITTESPPVIDQPLPTGNGLAYASNGDGTCTLIGVGTCRDVCIVIPERSPSGDRVTAIASRAFYGCPFATAIQIPTTVTNIGEMSFAACNNLVYISVTEGNAYYCDMDGILYSADGRTLILYPPMRAGNSYTISAAIDEIRSMAFYNCAYLTQIHYDGSVEDWERISIGTKNYSLIAAAKTFDAEPDP